MGRVVPLKLCNDFIYFRHYKTQHQSKIMQYKNILVAGASIAGPTVAWWLHKYGFKVTIVEKTETLRSGGYRVDVRGTSSKVAEKMGIWNEIEKYATHMTGSSMINASGKRTLDLEPGVYGIHESRDREIMRGDLSQVLYDATKNEIEYIFDNKIKALNETATDVDVTFDKGPNRTFDLVIAADGIYSTTRNIIFGENKEVLNHLHYFMVVFPIPNYLKLSNYELIYFTAGKLVNIFNAFDRDTKTLMLFRSDKPSDGFRKVDKQKQLLKDAFKGEGKGIEKLLEYVDDTDDFYFSPIDQVKMPTYSKGRCVLLGDAAYCPSPASGQGTSTAMVGAYILAGELAAANGDHKKAFQNYEQQMRPFIDRNQNIAVKTLSDTIPKTKLRAWFQNVAIKVMILFMGKNKVMKKMFDNKEITEIANSAQLKDYAANATGTVA